MKVFLALKSLLPSYGGPAFSVSRLALALVDAGIDVGLWAADGSALATNLLARQASVRRLDGSATEAMGKFGRPDVVHDNGIWLPHNHRLAKLALADGVPRVVSTRGMLDPWAINHKRLKKKLAWLLYQRADLCKATYLHATAAPEADVLGRLRLGVPVGQIPNGIDLAERTERDKSEVSTRSALFLGRIHPVKGLPLLIEAWARLRPHRWQLRIAGPDESGHRAMLERQVAAASLSDTVHFVGPLHDAAKERAFAGADLFVLPSLSESFGMAVGEALAHGLPVLATTAAPWPMLRERGCGWSVGATVDELTQGLRAATALESVQLSEMGERGRGFVRQEFSWPRVARQFVGVYESLLARRPQ